MQTAILSAGQKLIELNDVAAWLFRIRIILNCPTSWCSTFFNDKTKSKLGTPGCGFPDFFCRSSKTEEPTWLLLNSEKHFRKLAIRELSKTSV